jgi:pimeloyl-ACP methyl ester carboxylesterase
VRVNGLDVHVVDRGPSTAPVVLLVHGWPGSFTEFVEVAEGLAQKGYRVLVPSLPGFGFSEKPKRNFTFVDAAVCLAKVVRALGIHKYACQGGDYGSFVCTALGQIDEEHLVGVHLNMAVVLVPPVKYGSFLAWPLMFLLGPYGLLGFDKADYERSTRSLGLGFYPYIIAETGYFHEQATRPDTIGAILDDSPVALLAWIAEKFQTWSTHPEKGLNGDIPLTRILDDIQVYWVGRTGTSSVRWYKCVWDMNGAVASLRAPVHVPVGVADVEGEIYRPPRAWLPAKYTDLRRYTTFDRGGHFFAMENPAALVRDVHEFLVGLGFTAAKA